MDETQIIRLEAALTAAIAAHKRERRAEVERQGSGFERRFVLARLGLTPGDLDTVAAAASAADLPPALRDQLGRRLAMESARLLRLARAASPHYDLNRHIAVRRALLWAENRPLSDEDNTAQNTSGHVLNRRFRRSRLRPVRDVGPAGAGTVSAKTSLCLANRPRAAPASGNASDRFDAMPPRLPAGDLRL